MTIEQAISQLRAAYPGRSVSAQVEVWHHAHDDAREEARYCVSVVCEKARCFYGSTLEQAVSRAIDATRTPVADPAEVESHFAVA